MCYAGHGQYIESSVNTLPLEIALAQDKALAQDRDLIHDRALVNRYEDQLSSVNLRNADLCAIVTKEEEEEQSTPSHSYISSFP